MVRVVAEKDSLSNGKMSWIAAMGDLLCRIWQYKEENSTYTWRGDRNNVGIGNGWQQGTYIEIIDLCFITNDI